MFIHGFKVVKVPRQTSIWLCLNGCVKFLGLGRKFIVQIHLASSSLVGKVEGRRCRKRIERGDVTNANNLHSLYDDSHSKGWKESSRKEIETKQWMNILKNLGVGRGIRWSLGPENTEVFDIGNEEYNRSTSFEERSHKSTRYTVGKKNKDMIVRVDTGFPFWDTAFEFDEGEKQDTVVGIGRMNVRHFTLNKGEGGLIRKQDILLVQKEHRTEGKGESSKTAHGSVPWVYIVKYLSEGGQRPHDRAKGKSCKTGMYGTTGALNRWINGVYAPGSSRGKPILSKLEKIVYLEWKSKYIKEESEDISLPRVNSEDGLMELNKWAVAKIIGYKVDCEAVLRVFRSIWGNARLINSNILKENMVLFKFKTLSDKQVIFKRTLWSFEGTLLALVHFDPTLSLEEFDFQPLAVWVRINELSLGMMQNKTVEKIGNKIGKTIVIDMRFGKGKMGDFLRIIGHVLTECPGFSEYLQQPLQFGEWLRVVNNKQIEESNHKRRDGIIYIENESQGRSITSLGNSPLSDRPVRVAHERPWVLRKDILHSTSTNQEEDSGPTDPTDPDNLPPNVGSSRSGKRKGGESSKGKKKFKRMFRQEVNTTNSTMNSRVRTSEKEDPSEAATEQPDDVFLTVVTEVQPRQSPRESLLHFQAFQVFTLIWRFDGRSTCSDSRGSTDKKHNWEMISHLSSTSSLTCCMGGDFNEIIHPSEKKGGRRRVRVHMDDFQICLQDANMWEIQPKAGWYTWASGTQAHTFVQERIDRYVTNNDWRLMFSGCSVSTIPTASSDHSVLLLSMESVSPNRSHRDDYFKFDACWAKGKQSEIRGVSEIESFILIRLRFWMLPVSNEMEDIFYVATSYFTSLFRSSGATPDEEILQAIDHYVTMMDNEMLSRNFTAEEVTQAFSQVKPFENTRLKPLMPICIGENKCAIVPGAAIKLDMEKAYDRVEWDFILNVVLHMGFNVSFVNLIRKCISTVSFQVQINGALSDPFTLEKGLRQGDPLSPYLFLFYAQGLSVLLLAAQRRNELKGIHASLHGPRISHLLYTNDSILFMKNSIDELRRIKSILSQYEKASGKKVNFEKSNIFFSPNTLVTDRLIFLNELGVAESLDPGIYLGLPLVVGKDKRTTFNFIKDKIVKRIHEGVIEDIKFQARWDELKVRRVLSSEDVSQVLKTLIVPVHCDKILWCRHSSGSYSAKSGYNWLKIQNSPTLIAEGIWNAVAKANVL
ncbi:hypothetical protein F3Y22_tig00002237pilonHSYRG00644 [Hibiscus syriacus]|uniref:Reverse transcriptase domain-containing protein n=1 Tax=Hibiscus syriacus TaxID=106335 RepID=A0A6A3CRK9_HIBSY|nr:hypothetical protein F3Y22_tig00002237pilonHSYRG00644 [Hibiscus syriacus]